MKVVRRVASGKRGRFKVDLKPGRYVLDPMNGHPYPFAARRRVRVERGEYTSVAIHYKSGIE